MEAELIHVGAPTCGQSSVIGLEMAERAKLMRASKLFAGISNAECIRIASLARSRVFARNELLFMQGQQFRMLVLVESGCVKLTQLNANGGEVILALRGPHDAVDLAADPTVCHHTFTARAVSKCKALTWNSSIVGSLMTTTSQFSRNICCILTSQFCDLQERFHEMSTEKVERRLACTLIRLAKQFGKRTPGGTEIFLSRQELAQMSGTTLFTVSRLVTKWGKLGLVLPRREAVVMLNPERLELVSSDNEETSQRCLSSLADRARSSCGQWSTATG